MHSYFFGLLPSNLSHLRRFFGYTQKELAAHFDVTQEGYSKWERGKCFPVEERLTVIAQFYGHGITAHDMLHKTSDEFTIQILAWKNSTLPRS
jgi:transcriptional regulator with XRE-family HTH domain